MTTTNKSLQYCCDQLKTWTPSELKYLQQRINRVLITKMVEAEELSFSKSLHTEYNHYRKIVNEDDMYSVIGVANWTLDQFRSFFEEHGIGWEITFHRLAMYKYKK